MTYFIMNVLVELNRFVGRTQLSSPCQVTDQLYFTPYTTPINAAWLFVQTAFHEEG